MSWFSKKGKEEGIGLPELPSSNQFNFNNSPQNQEQKKELPKLPGFEQEEIKNNIADINSMEETIPQPPREFPYEKRTPSMMVPTKSFSKKAEPVFIRLDKFQTTVDTFEEIKEKISEIEEVLKKIREEKEREEKELDEWEKEIQLVKSRIEMIDKNIFTQLD
jgi:DNA repair exonuclease SbcCD ATPase subunit